MLLLLKLLQQCRLSTKSIDKTKYVVLTYSSLIAAAG